MESKSLSLIRTTTCARLIRMSDANLLCSLPRFGLIQTSGTVRKDL